MLFVKFIPPQWFSLLLERKVLSSKKPSSDLILYEPVVKTAVKDTTAAEDTFLGYFLSSLICGRTDEMSMKRATNAPALPCHVRVRWTQFHSKRSLSFDKKS